MSMAFKRLTTTSMLSSLISFVNEVSKTIFADLNFFALSTEEYYLVITVKRLEV